MKTLFKACYEDLWNDIFELLLPITLSWLHHITTFMPSNCHIFKTFDLLLEIFENHGILKGTLFLHSKIIHEHHEHHENHEHHKLNISPLPIRTRNESAQIISCLSDQIDRVENKIDAALLNNDAAHDVMWHVLGDLKR